MPSCIIQKTCLRNTMCKVSVNLVILMIKQIIEQLATESVEDVHLFQELGVQKMVLTFQVKTFFFEKTFIPGRV